MRRVLSLPSLLLLLLLTSEAASALAAGTGDLLPVGSARLRVLFWTIYDSTLYSPTGSYSGIEPGVALAITYRRSIAARELIDRTFEEWEDMQRMSVVQAEWRETLQQLWPDVEAGDTLTLRVTEELHSEFHFGNRLLGTVGDSRFTEQFLAIWLSPDTNYPDQRNALLDAAR